MSVSLYVVNRKHCLCGLIVRVRVVPRRTVVGDIDRHFDNLNGSHHQSHVNCVSYHPDDQTTQTTETPGFKPFTRKHCAKGWKGFDLLVVSLYIVNRKRCAKGWKGFELTHCFVLKNALVRCAH